MLTSGIRGDDYCNRCGEYVRWIRLISGRWIAVNRQPILYIPHAGNRWLVTGFDDQIARDCLIFKPYKGMDKSKLKRGYEIHAFTCGKDDVYGG